MLLDVGLSFSIASHFIAAMTESVGYLEQKRSMHQDCNFA
jgi:hypothetical protein